MTFLTVLGAAFVGSLLANAVFYAVVGKLAQRAERKRIEHFKKLEAECMEVIEKEQERMKNYVKMES
jgi:membrane protein DedA with SNARE-associated domain